MPITIAGSGTITGISAGGLPDDSIIAADIAAGAVTTAKIADANITAAKLDGAQSGSAPIYGARAWVRFDGSVSGTFAGGASTVTRVAGSTTATVTTTNAHGLITGNAVYALTGVAAGAYTVTVLTSTTFTITTAATTALSAVAITFAVNPIQGSGNVSSIADNGVGNYTINFITALVDTNYNVAASAGTNTSQVRPYTLSPYAYTTTALSVNTHTVNSTSPGLLVDPDFVHVAIFR